MADTLQPSAEWRGGLLLKYKGGNALSYKGERWGMLDLDHVVAYRRHMCIVNLLV